MLPQREHVENVVLGTGADLDQAGQSLVAFHAVLHVDGDLSAVLELRDHLLEALEGVDVDERVGERLGGVRVRAVGDDLAGGGQAVGVAVEVGGFDRGVPVLGAGGAVLRGC